MAVLSYGFLAKPQNFPIKAVETHIAWISQNETLLDKIKQLKMIILKFYHNLTKDRFNSLWLSDTIRRHGSTPAQVIACHCWLVNIGAIWHQCWLVSNDILCHSPASSFTRSAHDLNPQNMSSEMTLLKSPPYHISQSQIDYSIVPNSPECLALTVMTAAVSHHLTCVYTTEPMLQAPRLVHSRWYLPLATESRI